MSIADIVILVLLGTAVGFALRALQKGKGRCSGGCAQCARRCSRRAGGGNRK